MKRKSLVIILCMATIVCFTACSNSGGKKTSSTSTSDNNSVTTTEYTKDVANESTDTEVDSISTSEDNTTEAVQNAIKYIDTYYPASDYWQGSDYFDIEAYLEANCVKIKKGYLDVNTGSFVESDDKHEFYQAWLDMNRENNIEFEVYGIGTYLHIMHGDDGFHYEFLPTELFDNLDDKVTVNQSGWTMPRTGIESMDYVMQLLKQHPTELDPFTDYNDGRYRSWFSKNESHIMK